MLLSYKSVIVSATAQLHSTKSELRFSFSFIQLRGEWNSGIAHYAQNQKVPSLNLTAALVQGLGSNLVGLGAAK